jgi:hypothetical protein
MPSYTNTLTDDDLDALTDEELAAMDDFASVGNSASDWAEAAILEHITGKSAMTAQGTHLALVIEVIDDSMIFTADLPEPSDGGYGRPSIAGAFATAAANGVITNTSDISFPTATASWNEIVGWAIVDDTHVILHGTFVESKSVEAGDTLTFATGELTIRCS